MVITIDEASKIFNEVMCKHNVALKTDPSCFHIGDRVVLPAMRSAGEQLSQKFFNVLFASLKPSIYYNYMIIEAFEAVARSGKLRFYSTKKKSSIGEFIPLCRELKLDGLWREDADGKVSGEFSNVMDNLFYKSFVSCPVKNSSRLWHDFANKGTGVRIQVEIKAKQGYPDFRKMSYQRLQAFQILSDLLESFRTYNYSFISQGFSRMPAYYQLKHFDYQNECRLIASLNPEHPDHFPFTVERDPNQECNYIDCSLEFETCRAFDIDLLNVEQGPNCDDKEWNRISGILASWWQKS